MAKKASTQERALITGASSGIGFHLAQVFARNGHGLVVVSPIPSEIQEVATQIQSDFGVDVKAIASDLTSLDDSVSAFQDVADQVGILCNNAGVGRRGHFQDIPLAKHLEIIRLNVEAVVRLTAFFLPRFVARGHGRILNTASIAGFEPGPQLATYHASKAFVLSLTESLATENKDTGVVFTALCPGPVDTDFYEKAAMPESFAFQKGNLMAPQEVAEAAYQGLMSGERVVVPGAVNKMMVAMSHLTSKSAQASMNEKQYQDVAHKRDRGDKEMPALAKRGN